MFQRQNDIGFRWIKEEVGFTWIERDRFLSQKDIGFRWIERHRFRAREVDKICESGTGRQALEIDRKVDQLHRDVCQWDSEINFRGRERERGGLYYKEMYMRGIGGRDVGSGREGEREHFQSSETLCVSRPSLVTPPFRLVSYSSSLSLSLSLTHSLTNKRSETTKFTLHYISFSLSLFPYTVLAQDYPQHNSLSQISGKQLFRNTITKVHPCLNINVSKFPRFWKLWERKSSNKR